VATINSVISLTDRMTPTLRNIGNSIGDTISKVERLDKTLSSLGLGDNAASSSKAYQRVESAVEKVRDKIAKLPQKQEEHRKKTQETTSAYDGMIGKVAGLAAKLAAAAGAASLIGAAIERTDTIDTATRSLTVLTGDAGVASNVMNGLSEAIQGTPIALDQVALGAKKMVAAGMEGEKVQGVFTAISDAAYGVGNGTESIDQMVNAMADLQASGTVYAEDLNRMMDAGVPVWQILANQTGVSVAEMKDSVSQGSLSSVEAIEMLVSGIENGTSGVAGQTATMAGLAKTAGETISGSFANTKTSVVKSLTVITDSLKGPIVGALSLITGGFKEFTNVTSGIGEKISFAFQVDGFEGAAQALGSGIVEMANYGISMLPQMLDTGIKIAMSFVQGVTQALPSLIIQATVAITDMISTLAGNIPQIIETGVMILEALLQGLTGAIPMLINRIPEIITSITEGITTALPMVLDIGVKLFSALVEGAPAIIQHILAVLPQILTAIINTLFQSMPMIMDAGLKLLTSLIGALPEIIMTIVLALPMIITSIHEALVNNIPVIIETGFKLLVALVENLPAIIAAIIKVIPEIIARIVDTLYNGIIKIKEVGYNILTGIWEGILSGWDWFTGKISEMGQNIVDNIKGVFDINSPSKVLASQVGEMLPAGIGVGFENAMPGLLQTVNGELGGMTKNIKTPSLSIGATASVSASGDTAGSAGMQQNAATYTSATAGMMTQTGVLATNMQNGWTAINTNTVATVNAMSTQVLTDTTGFTGAMTTTINALLPEFRSAGAGMMTELLEGINTTKEQVLSGISSLVSEMLNIFITGLGIHSPSRVMQWIGEMMGAGVMKGFSSDQINQYTLGIIDRMQNSFSTGNLDVGQVVSMLGDNIPDLVTKLGVDPSEASSLLYPLIGNAGTITSYFGLRDAPTDGASTYHEGIDLAAATGTPIAAMMGGLVTLAGEYGGYGNAVIVDHGNGYKTLYGHMSAINVAAGQNINAGTNIGAVGNTGVSTGSHLHLSMYKDGAAIDPLPYLQGAPIMIGNPLANALMAAYNSKKYGSSLASGSYSGDLAGWITQALNITGMYSDQNLQNLISLALGESGGDPNAINLWDSNAAAGIPSKGLMQVIDPTFAAYKLPGYDNIWDPVSNIIASIRYQMDRYGYIRSLPGYAVGTRNARRGLALVGERGPEYVSMNGGERVYTANETGQMANMANRLADARKRLSLSNADAVRGKNAGLHPVGKVAGQTKISISMNNVINSELDTQAVINKLTDELSQELSGSEYGYYEIA